MAYKRMLLPMLVLAAVVGLSIGVSPRCKNCVMRGKNDNAKFRLHSDMCLAQSGADPAMVDSLLLGNFQENQTLKKHIYCVLQRCKVIGKDGKLLKSGVIGKLVKADPSRNALKMLENCYKQSGYTPEELAWNLFKCGYDKKALFFEYMQGHNTQTSNTDNGN